MEKPPNMAPTWLRKIDTKVDQNYDGFRDRVLKRFWWIFDAKMEPSWHQHRSKSILMLEKRKYIIRAVAAVGARILRFGSSIFGAKVDQKSI